MAVRFHHYNGIRINGLINNPGSIGQVSTASLALIPPLNSFLPREVNVGDNFVYSPLGAHMCLSILRSGAVDETAKELKRAAKYRTLLPIHEMNDGYKAIIRGLTEETWGLLAPNTDLKPTVHFISCLYVPNRFDNINAQFVEAIQQNYNCRVVTDDLKNNESIDWINVEVQLATGGRVTNVLGHADFSSVQKYGNNIGMVMVNVLHFRALWEGHNAFDQRDTRTMGFTKTDGTKVMVPMMHNPKMYGSYSNIRENGCTIAALYFEGGRYCMIIYLPTTIRWYRDHLTGILHAHEAIHRLETEMTKLAMDKIAADFVRYHRRNHWVDGNLLLNVSLPRFNATFNVSLSNAFKRSKVRNTFNPTTANFTGIRPMNADGSEQLYFSDCIQKVVVKIDETSAPPTRNLSVYPPNRLQAGRRVKRFCVDHPFMFSIYDYINNVTIAHGSVYDPLQESCSGQAGQN